MGHITNNNAFHFGRAIFGRSSDSSSRSSFDRPDPFKVDPFDRTRPSFRKQGHSVGSVPDRTVARKKFDYIAWRNKKRRKLGRGPVSSRGPLRGRS